MMTPDQWADRIEAAVGNATAILNTVARLDFPEGVVVIPATLSPGHLGMAYGSGHALAAAHGEVMGRAGILLDPWQTIMVHGGPGVEVTALHELAHALHQPAEDITDDQAATAAALDITATENALGAARAHHPAWAAAFALYVRRAIRFRSRIAEPMAGILECQLGKYGFPGADAVLEALGPVDDAEPLRPVLDFKGPRVYALFDALPREQERAEVIAAAGHYRR
jgi:hypothetical protein